MINFPPEKLFNPSNLEKLDYDVIILWMLKNNKICKWSNFCEKPLEIPVGTLSRHLDQLKRNGFVKKVSRGSYKITSAGKREFYARSSSKQVRTLNYPPKIILSGGRNYDNWIIWMLYNNNYCSRSDFLEKPLSINQSSLSKNLNLLIEKGCITKEDGKYQITQSGKLEYSKMLQNYDLDRQTILEEDSKKIQENIKKIIEFFTKFSIEDTELQFIFLSIILKLDFEKVRPLLKEEELFFKIILFFSMNHPNFYPNFKSSEEFSERYDIKTTTLNYYVAEISEGKIYPTRFFKLSGPRGGSYYFQTGGKLEKMIEVIIENQINKHVYLTKLFSKTEEELSIVNIKFILDPIIKECCVLLFNEDFRESLRDFLPGFIRHLAYKIEVKKELKNSYDKLELIIWQDMATVFESKISNDLKFQYQQKIKEFDIKIKKSPNQIELYYSKVRLLIYFNQYKEVLSLLEVMRTKFPKNEIDIMMKKASILRKMRDLDSGLKIIDALIKKFPNNTDLFSYKAFWLQYMDRKEDALEIIENLINKEPNKGIYYDNYGEILMYFEDYEEATKKFLKALITENNEWYYYQTYIKLGICYKALNMLELAQNNLSTGIKIIKQDKQINSDIKQKWLAIANLFLTDIQSNIKLEK